MQSAIADTAPDPPRRPIADPIAADPASSRPDGTGRLPIWTLLALWVAAAGAASPVLWSLSAPHPNVDVYAHAQILLKGMADGTVPWYTIFYGLLYVATLGQATTYDDLRLPAVVILSVAMGAKAAVALWVFSRSRARLGVTLLAVLFVMVVVPLKLSAATSFYLGKITPTIWHNSTTVMLMPVSLVLFVLAVDILRRERAPWYATGGLVAVLVLDLLVKPNFGMLFLPVFGIYVLVLAFQRRRSEGWWRPFSRYLFLAVAGIATLGVQYWGTYTNSSVDYENAVGFLAAWRVFTSQVPLAVFESLLLPVLATIFLWRQASDRTRTSIALAWGCTLIGIMVFTTLVEIDLSTGRMLTHGNWSWGMQVAMFVTYVVLIREWLRQSLTLAFEGKIIVLALAVVQFATGVTYLTHLLNASYF